MAISNTYGDNIGIIFPYRVYSLGIIDGVSVLLPKTHRVCYVSIISDLLKTIQPIRLDIKARQTSYQFVYWNCFCSWQWSFSLNIIKHAFWTQLSLWLFSYFLKVLSDLG